MLAHKYRPITAGSWGMTAAVVKRKMIAAVVIHPNRYVPFRRPVGRRKKNRPHKAAGFSVPDEGGLMPRRRVLGLGSSSSGVLGSVSRLAGRIGSTVGGALHGVHGGCRSGGGRSSSRSSGGGSRSSGGGSRSSSGSRSGRGRSGLLCRISSLLSGVSRLLGVLRGILRAVAASRQQRDERGGEKGTRKLHGGSPLPWNAIWPCINNAFVEIAPLLLQWRRSTRDKPV